MKVYAINKIDYDNNEYEISYFYDSSERKKIKISDCLRYNEGDFIYQNEDDEWLLVDAYIYLMAENKIRNILSMNEEERNKHQDEYNFALLTAKEYFKDPCLFDKKTTLEFLKTRKELYRKAAQ